MRTFDTNTIGYVFRRRRSVFVLVAVIWSAMVTFYVVGGLRPHGYIGDETEAQLIWLGWTGGGLLLAWMVMKTWLGSSQMRRAQSVGASKHTIPVGCNDQLDDPRQSRADSREECGLRMGVDGFGYYCGAIRTDDD